MTHAEGGGTVDRLGAMAEVVRWARDVRAEDVRTKNGAHSDNRELLDMALAQLADVERADDEAPRTGLIQSPSDASAPSSGAGERGETAVARAQATVSEALSGASWYHVADRQDWKNRTADYVASAVATFAESYAALKVQEALAALKDKP